MTGAERRGARMTTSLDPRARVDRLEWKKLAPAIVSVVAVVVVVLWAALPAPWGVGLFTPAPSPWPIYAGPSIVATRCSGSPCTVGVAVTADSFLFMGFGYSVAQAVAGTMEIQGYPFILANELTKQNFGTPSVQAGLYYWAITSTANVTVSLNYGTPAIADVFLVDFTNATVATLPSIGGMGDGSGTSIFPVTSDICNLGATYTADETVVAITMAGTNQPGPLAPEMSPIAAWALPAEVTGVPYSLVGEIGVLTTQGPTQVTGTLAVPSAYATVCLGIIPA